MDKQDVLKIVNKAIKTQKKLSEIDIKREIYKEDIRKIQNKFLIKYNNAKEEEFESISNQLNQELLNLKLEEENVKEEVTVKKDKSFN